MKWTRLYLLGYTIFVLGVLAALWKAGVLEQIGAGWTAIGIVIAIGLGIIFAVTGSGEKRTIEVDRSS
jgi:hypothetical protein